MVTEKKKLIGSGLSYTQDIISEVEKQLFWEVSWTSV